MSNKLKLKECLGCEDFREERSGQGGEGPEAPLRDDGGGSEGMVVVLW